DGRAGARRTHGETDVGAGESGGIVDAVTDHADLAAVAQLGLDRTLFVFGQEIAVGLVDTGLFGDGARGEAVVARQHQGTHVKFVQARNGGAAGGLQRVGNGGQSQYPGAVGQGDGGFALGFVGFDLCLDVLR